MNWKRILVLSPHPEDGELGCGASVVRFLEEGRDVFWVTFTIAEQSTHPPFDPDAQKFEMQRSTGILGVKPENIEVHNWAVRTFKEHRQEILDEMIRIRKDVRPDLVFFHSRDDVHQDHQAICEEAQRAFKQSTMLGYELPWNLFQFKADHFIEVTEAQARKKAEALACYQSRSYRPYLSESKVLAQMTLRGLQIETDYAECFEIIRSIDRLPS
ncbi:MAG: PIG-L family deacetylase [Proteobacteria bacterium]|nr:PIG-L family deacetylase [Pseudomonadota bacterium]